MRRIPTTLLPLFFLTLPLSAQNALPPAFPADPASAEERTSFQTSQPWSPNGNLRSDVAMVYGINRTLPERIKGWRDRGYRIHVMTGVAWGDYQDYLYGRFDGVNHEDNAQTDRHGNKISHGGEVYYMCPAENYGEFLSQGIMPALEAGAEAIHLEEPEFWARAGYSEGFKREWKSHYGTDWTPPHETVDGQWRSSKLKYFLYRRALTQIFDRVQRWNREKGANVRCYVPTHSLLNYAHWCIVSPQSSLARIDGCDGYIAQVWTGTARTPNFFRGEQRERTFETAFLEYGVMCNLVRSTGRRVWFLNDPIEDNPGHDWGDYRRNWESTLVASLLQPDVWRFEVAPWPERVFGGRYPRGGPRENRRTIPPEYATELQVVNQALADMKQDAVQWTCGTRGLGVLVSDSLMFQREQPTPSDPNMAHFYGQALPLVKRGMPVEPVQLENAVIPGFLDPFKVLTLSYQGQKPLSPEVHTALTAWVRAGGVLVVVDDDKDPYNKVREWWNGEGTTGVIPRGHLFTTLGIEDSAVPGDGSKVLPLEKGGVMWLRKSPVGIGLHREEETVWIDTLKRAAEKAALPWTESPVFILRRGPYVIAAGLDETGADREVSVPGSFVNLFDSELRALDGFTASPGSRSLLLDLEKTKGRTPENGAFILASAGKALPDAAAPTTRWTVEGVAETPGIVLAAVPRKPASITLDGVEAPSVDYAEKEGLVRVRFTNQSFPRVLEMRF